VEIFDPASTVRVTLRLAVYHKSVRLGAEPLETHGQNYFPQWNTCGHCSYITSSLTTGWVCHFQLLLALTSTFILESESRGTRGRILLSQIRDLTFCRLLRLAGLRWRYSTPPPPASAMNHDTFITPRRPEYKSPCRTVPLLLCVSVFIPCSGSVFPSRCPAIDFSGSLSRERC
jgi:hypothetical protein